jgi:hypothetical protein
MSLSVNVSTALQQQQQLVAKGCCAGATQQGGMADMRCCWLFAATCCQQGIEGYHAVLVCVQAFVQFADVASAQRAKDAISGRMFAGSIVQAYHVPVNVFQQVPDSIH